MQCVQCVRVHGCQWSGRSRAAQMHCECRLTMCMKCDQPTSLLLSSSSSPCCWLAPVDRARLRLPCHRSMASSLQQREYRPIATVSFSKRPRRLRSIERSQARQPTSTTHDNTTCAIRTHTAHHTLAAGHRLSLLITALAALSRHRLARSPRVSCKPSHTIV